MREHPVARPNGKGWNMPAATNDVERLLRRLKSLGSRRNIEGMARYGIVAPKTFGVPAPAIRAIAKSIEKNHALAQRLWSTGILEVQALAALIDDPAAVTERQMEHWVRDFDNWAICDTCCGNLFDKTPYAVEKATSWSLRKEEFIKRAAFSMMAALAVHDKAMHDHVFKNFLRIVEREAHDERNFVRKAVNWGLRQIGKRNEALNRAAVASARRIGRQQSRSAKWIAADALKELTSPAVQRRIKRRGSVSARHVVGT
jgi:3-methyladenine DNA glycosylase AlkD